MKKTVLIFSMFLIIGMIFAQTDIDGIESEDYSFLFEKPIFKWGADYTVANGTISEFDFGYDYNNDICYAMVKFDRDSVIGGDTVWLYKSYDLGATWDNGTVIMTNYDGYVYNPNIVITDLGKIACFAIYAETTGTRRIYMREFTDSTLVNSGWEFVSNGTGDTVYSYDVDYCDNFYYLTYLSVDTSFDASPYIFGTICHEDSNNWGNRNGLFVNPVTTEKPKIAAAANGYAYVAFIENRIHLDTLNIRIKRTFDYGATWESSISATNLVGQEISNIDIAASKMDTSRVVWITTQYNNFGTWGYYYSTDSCATVTYGDTIYLDDGWIEHLGSIEAHPHQPWITGAFLSDSSDLYNIAFFYIMDSNPTTILDLQSINNNNADSMIIPLGTNRDINSAVLYVGENQTNLYMDAYNNYSFVKNSNNSNSVENVYAQPVIFKEKTNIYFNAMNNNIEIKIFDTMGRIVWNKHINVNEGENCLEWNGTSLKGEHLPAGKYFIKINDGNNISITKVTLLN